MKKIVVYPQIPEAETLICEVIEKLKIKIKKATNEAMEEVFDDIYEHFEKQRQ